MSLHAFDLHAFSFVSQYILFHRRPRLERREKRIPRATGIPPSPAAFSFAVQLIIHNLAPIIALWIIHGLPKSGVRVVRYCPEIRLSGGGALRRADGRGRCPGRIPRREGLSRPGDGAMLLVPERWSTGPSTGYEAEKTRGVRTSP